MSKGTTHRSIRADDELWDGFGEAVAEREPKGTDRSKVLRVLMQQYIDGTQAVTTKGDES